MEWHNDALKRSTQVGMVGYGWIKQRTVAMACDLVVEPVLGV